MLVKFVPLLQSWKRIEARSRTGDFSDNLANPIHDPLWMLTRQWQFGEFQAEDAGSAINASVHYHQSSLQALINGDKPPQALDNGQPLDAQIERSEVVLDIDLRLEMGRHWLKMLRRALPKAVANKVSKAFGKHPDLQFQPPELNTKKELGEQASRLVNERYLQMIHAAIRMGSIDGGVLYQHIRRGRKASTFLSDKDKEVDQLGREFLAWFTRVYGQPTGKTLDYWQNDRLEYQFACTIPQQDGSTQQYRATEYHGRQLGWYSGDLETPKDGPTFSGKPLSSQTSSFIPSPVRFAGMPNTRWWALEDNTINFGDIGRSTTDLSKLIFAEFGLVYGNDWLIIPFSVPTGSVANIEKIVVTDVFGVKTEVRSVRETSPDDPWRFFQLYGRDLPVSNALLLPPVNPQMLESKPVEEVHFMRDQIANMVWGIEKVVPDGLGNGTDGYDSGQRLRFFLEALEGAPEKPLLKNEAKVRYEIATEVPENWIPFIAKQVENGSVDGQIKLQRAAMPRVLKGFPIERIRPRTSLLRSGMEGKERSPFFIQEEEIPRAGAILKLKWRRTRWLDGRVVVWLAKEKTNGRGEADSALQFDRLREKTET